MASNQSQPQQEPIPAGEPHAARGPLVVATANPRYFTVAAGEQQAVYLTGSHIWNNLHDGMGPARPAPTTPSSSTSAPTSTSWPSAATTSSGCGAVSSSSPRPPGATTTCA